MIWKENLRNLLFDAVDMALKDHDKAIVAFSGGVDSTLLSKICINLKRRIYLVTLGFPTSHDLLFSKKISTLLGLGDYHLTYELTSQDLTCAYKDVKSIIKCNNLSHLENCVAFFLMSKLIRTNNLGSFFFNC